MHKRRILVSMVAAAAVALSACSGSAQTDPSKSGAPGGANSKGGGAVPVTTAKAAEKSMPLSVTAIGTVEAFSTVEVRPQVSGPLASVAFQEGQDVTAGQLMFTIDPQPFQLALEQAQAVLTKDTAAAENARQQLKRADDLLPQGLIPKADYDTTAATAKAAEGALKVDQSQIDAAQLNLKYTKIPAPISGRTGALFSHQGAIVHTTDTNPLVIINQTTPIRVVFSVPGQYLPQIRAGQAKAALKASARPADGGEGASGGDVNFIDNTIDASTSTIRLKAVFPNQDRRLWPGELLTVQLQLAVDDHAITVPNAAVQNGQQGQYVYVVNPDATVAMRPVTVSRTVGDDAIITAGVKVGEEIVTDGQLRLVPGAKISVKPPAAGKAGA